MNKYLAAFALFFISAISLQAQVNSPYAQYGIGSLSSNGFGRSEAMGGIGIATQSNQHLNPINPASYVNIDSLNVIYELGLSTGFNKVVSSVDNNLSTDTEIDYFALGFRATKFYAMGFGLKPASNFNYTLVDSKQSDVNGQVDTYYHGEGGLSRIYWDNSFKIGKNFALGATLGYTFGAINRVNTILFENLYTLNTKYDEKTNLYNFYLKGGLHYTAHFKENKSLVIGAVFEPQLSLNTKRNVLAGTTTSRETDDLYYEELIDTTLFIDDVKGTSPYPSLFGFGVSYSKKQNWTIGADFYSQNWEALSYNTLGDSLKTSITINFGAEFIPDINSVTGYHKRMRYRIGAYYNQSQLEIKNQPIDDYGITFGVGLPLKRSNTTFNLAFKFGQRGTTNENLLRENYGMLSLNLSLSDIWFVKRKFN